MRCAKAFGKQELDSTYRAKYSVSLVWEGLALGLLPLGIISGMRVLAWSTNLDEQKATAAGATYAPLDELVRSSDVITLHLRLSERTNGIITARHFSLMKPTACFVTHRPRTSGIDEDALVGALREGRIRGAALDVFQTEPLPIDHPLRSLENVVLAPHMG